MKEHFSPRSMVFYGCAIASVVILFTVTTAYGERNLQAPRRIDGRYPLSMSALPDCFQAKSVNLLLQQSGIFLTGAFLADDASEQAVQMAQERPPLSGRWRDDQLTLEGQLGGDWNCQSTVKIEGMVTKDGLNGMMQLSAVPDAIAFSSKRQVPQPKELKH